MKSIVIASLLILVGTAAQAVSSPAYAVDVKYWGANVDFVQKLAAWYEEVPEALKKRMYDAQILVVKDKKTLAEALRWNKAPNSDVAKFSAAKRGFIGIAYIGVPSGVQQRSLVFIQDEMMRESEYWQQKSVLHEMMHLFDGGPARPAPHTYMSEGAEFREIWEADKKDWLKSDPRYKPILEYYFSDPTEAFADAGARLIVPVTDKRHELNDKLFKTYLRRSIVYVRGVLLEHGMLILKDYKVRTWGLQWPLYNTK
jgi:hypothetical protein